MADPRESHMMFMDEIKRNNSHINALREEINRLKS